MKFAEERGRLESILDAGTLSWRQYNAGMAFIREASRQIVAARDRYRAAQRPDDDPELRAEVEGILAAYKNWSAANERSERGMYLRQGRWVAR